MLSPVEGVAWPALRHVARRLRTLQTTPLTSFTSIYSRMCRAHLSKLGMRSLAAPESARSPFRIGSVVTLQGMAIEALNDAYAKIESVTTFKQQSRGRLGDGGVPADNKEYRVRLCGGHLHCMDVAESLMKECVAFLLVKPFYFITLLFFSSFFSPHRLYDHFHTRSSKCTHILY
jgi:hypothetical protein